MAGLIPDSPDVFAHRVIQWQHQHGRHDLPWQGTRDPYRIWLSEIMLQQTQVAAVIPYYTRFLACFPDVSALARATASAVMAAWAGLGYYSRARNLHGCAQIVVEKHGGRFPSSVAELSSLPGIGRSTAAAIAVFAFGARAAILDGNVKRVLARQFGIEGYPGAAVVERQLWALAEATLPMDGMAAYTQGLMDLGATLCTRTRPRCGECPVHANCLARRDGRTAELPTARPPKLRPVRHTTLALIRDTGQALLLETRPPSGIWGGLMSLPEFEADAGDADLHAAIAARYALAVRLDGRLPAVHHAFSHYSLVMHPRLATIERALGAAAPNAHWVSPADLAEAGLPAPIRRLLDELSGGPLIR